MIRFIILFSAGFILPCFICAQEVFENEYFRIALPEGMEKYVTPTETDETLKNVFRYRNGTSIFTIRKMESKLTASEFLRDYEKAMKKMGRPVQLKRFNVNGNIFPGLVTVDNSSGSSDVNVFILFDNGRHKLPEAGNAYLFQLDMTYLLEDEAKQQPINEKALQSLTLKKTKFDFFKTNDFSVIAPSLSFVYYGTSSPNLMLPSNPLVTLSFGHISEGTYGTSPNPAFEDLLKREFKKFKELYSKATVAEFNINGYKAALMKGKYENKEYKSCDWNYMYLIEVSPNLVRSVKYQLLCEYSEIQQPGIDEIIKTFVENKKY